MVTAQAQMQQALDHVGNFGIDTKMQRQINQGPPVADADAKKTVQHPDSVHEQYEKFLPHFELAHDAYYSSEGFLNGDRLSKYSILEDDKRFIVRQQRAYFISMVRLLVNVYVNAIYGVNIVRNFSGLPIDPMKLRGPRGDWESTMRHWLTQKIVYGGALCGLDRKTADPINTAEDEEKNPLIPFVSTPLRVTDWSLGGTQFEWVKILEKPANNRGSDWRNPKMREDLIKVWDTKGWSRFEKKGGAWVETRGDTELGIVPIVPMVADYPDDPGSWYGSTDFLQVARVNLRAYNLMSEMDDQMASSAFNGLAIPCREGNEPQFVNFGPGKGMAYDPTLGGPPSFFTIDPAPVELGIKMLELLWEQAYEIARLGSASTSRKPATAVQKIFENEEAEKSIRAYADAAERAERELIRVALRYKGEEPAAHEEQLNDPKVLKLPRKYDLNVLRENYVAMATQILSIKWSSQKANKHYEKHFCTSLVPMDSKMQQEISEEIEKGPGLGVGIEQTNPQNISRPITDHNALTPGTNDQAGASTAPKPKELRQ